MRNPRTTICVTAVVLCLAGSPVNGAVYFNDGGIHNIDYEIAHDVRVDLDAPGMQTTVNWLEGASIPSPYRLRAHQDSVVNISGGSIGRELLAYDSTQMTVSGGSMGQLNIFDSSQVTMSGGSIGQNLWARGSSQVTVSGGSIGRELWAGEYSQVTMSGGSISTELWAADDSQVTLSGGSIGGELRLSTSGILTIHGSDFAVDGTPFGYGELTSILGGRYVDEPYRHLTGTLASGDLLDNDFRIGTGCRIVLVPEPATFLLLGLGAVLLRRKR